MGNTATILSREKKGNRFQLPVEESAGEAHLEEQRRAVQAAIGTKLIASRWRKNAAEHAGGGKAVPGRSFTDHDTRASESYTGGVRVFRGSRLKALSALGDYRILRKLGEGSFAQVKLAEHIPTGQKVAIKLFDKAKKLSAYEMKHFYREATVLQRVQNKHAATAYQFLDAEFVYALVFELIKTDLLEDVTTNGPYREWKARVTIRQVIAGIEAVHAVDLVHRDLKLENIGVDHNGVIKLLDFGLAGDIRNKDALETQCGTMVYSAPELLGESPYGKEVDIWSIGIVLYSLLYARLPYDDGTRRNRSLTQLHAMMLDHEYELPEGSPESLHQLFRCLLEVKPHRRITCPALWKDPWIADADGTPLEPITLTQTTTVVTEANIDMEVVKAVANTTGNPVDVCKQSVIRNRCDPLCGAYHMRVRRKADAPTGLPSDAAAASDPPAATAVPVAGARSTTPKGSKRESRMDSLRKVFKRTGSGSSKGSKDSPRLGRKGGGAKPTRLQQAQGSGARGDSSRSPRTSPSDSPSRKIRKKQVTPK
eukprot:m.456990 g.456990  ORF g.456990 m.456990 type:complete len:538 (-) comp21162_c0_seq1:1657-3270(-)